MQNKSEENIIVPVRYVEDAKGIKIYDIQQIREDFEKELFKFLKKEEKNENDRKNEGRYGN